MGRYSVEKSMEFQGTPSNGPVNNINWPTSFPKEVIGIERNGVILQHQDILTPADVIPTPFALEGIRALRLKGYKVIIFSNESLISTGRLTAQHVDATNQRLMEVFGLAGILTIDGLLYSTTNSKQDIYSMPNNGMLKKAENDFKVSFKGGYFVGDKMHDLKAGESSGSKPILIKSGDYENTLIKLDTFANRELKNKTKIFNNLLDFANSLT